VKTPRALASIMVCVMAVAVGLAVSACRDPRETTLSSGEQMEDYLAERIVLERRVSGVDVPAEAALSSRGWLAVVEILGTGPKTPDGFDLYVRYYAGIPAIGPGAESAAPVAGQAGYAVARVRDPDRPAGPVTFRFPRDGALWEDDMARLMPEEYWDGRQGADDDELEAAWRERLMDVEAGEDR
jgi:hypothetical protein